MNSKDYSITMLVDNAPVDVFNAINNVRGWWSENIEGPTDIAGSDFQYHYKDVHVCTILVTELIPGERVVWKVLKNSFSFIEGNQEWLNDEMVFAITAEDTQTRITFTQHGLTPADECYDVCNDAWNGFIGNSLRKLITTGLGEPTPKDQDGAFNEELIEKWNLNDAPAEDYNYRFPSSKPIDEVFAQLVDVRSWWSGLFNESFEGRADKLDDTFTFNAGDGVHYSRQRLVELRPNERITWHVEDSMLSFLQQPDEWTGTQISFEISKPHAGEVEVTFTHSGLRPAIECFPACSSAWTQYMENLAKRLK